MRPLWRAGLRGPLLPTAVAARNCLPRRRTELSHRKLFPLPPSQRPGQPVPPAQPDAPSPEASPGSAGASRLHHLVGPFTACHAAWTWRSACLSVLCQEGLVAASQLSVSPATDSGERWVGPQEHGLMGFSFSSKTISTPSHLTPRRLPRRSDAAGMWVKVHACWPAPEPSPSTRRAGERGRAASVHVTEG